MGGWYLGLLGLRGDVFVSEHPTAQAGRATDSFCYSFVSPAAMIVCLCEFFRCGAGEGMIHWRVRVCGNGDVHHRLDASQEVYP